MLSGLRSILAVLPCLVVGSATAFAATLTAEELTYDFGKVAVGSSVWYELPISLTYANGEFVSLAWFMAGDSAFSVPITGKVGENPIVTFAPTGVGSFTGTLLSLGYYFVYEGGCVETWCLVDKWLNPEFSVSFTGTGILPVASLDSVVPSTVPIPAALPLFVTTLAGFGLTGWYRRRRQG